MTLALPDIPPDCEIVTRIEIETNVLAFPDHCPDDVKAQIEQHVVRGVRGGKLETIGGECNVGPDGKIACQMMLGEFPVSDKEGTAWNIRGVVVGIKGLRFLSDLKSVPTAPAATEEEIPLPPPTVEAA